MLEIGVQSRNVVEDSCPEKGFRMLMDFPVQILV